MSARESSLDTVQRELTAFARRARATAARMHPELSLVAYTILAHLEEQQGCRATDLAAHYLLDKSTVSRQVASLEKLGFIERRVDEADHRVQVLHLAPGGIEILAAAIPMDAVFLGKLFAMLAISLVGICVWGSIVGGLTGLHGIEGMFGGRISLHNLPEPGVGWPLFLMLGFVYFAMAYLLLGSVLLAVGSLATTVREVQTLSMPVTMAQVFVFLLATMAVSDQGGPLEWAAIAFPFSSPFAMLARAAQEPAIWPHLAALLWQLLWVGLTIRFGATLFRRHVMQSGPRVRSKRVGRKSSGVAEAGSRA